MSDEVSYDKVHAVYSAVNHKTIDQDSGNDNTENGNAEIENLIHESGKLQLNSYQAFVQNLMNPRSDIHSLMLVHMTGTGKTITALATATEYVRQFRNATPETAAVSSVVVLGFTNHIFKKELLSHPEFTFVNQDEAKRLKELEQHMHESSQIAEQYYIAQRRYRTRLSKRKINGIYQFYGYRQFATRIINMADLQNMVRQHLIKLKNAAKNTDKKTTSTENNDHKITENNDASERVSTMDIDSNLLQSWIDNGDVRVNTPFIKTFAQSLIICDEVHNLYRGDSLNTYGVAIQLVIDYFFKTLKTNDADYGAVRSLLLSATPLTTNATEIIPITRLLTGEVLARKDIFKTVKGVDEITPKGLASIRQIIAGKISYIMDDNPNEYPSSEFVGEKLPGIASIKFVRTKPAGTQLKSIEHWTPIKHDRDGNKGLSMIKDMTFPATKNHPHGVTTSRSIADLDSLSAELSVRKDASGLLSSQIFHVSKLKNYSSKYTKLIEICKSLKAVEHGKIFIYHPNVQGSGTDLIASILIANGFVMWGDAPSADSVCLHCDATLRKHKSVKGHDFAPVGFTYINGNLGKAEAASRLAAFNNNSNTNGEKLKIIIGSRAMRESHTLKACRHVIIAHEPSSISEMIQIIGRAIRKHVHSMLPRELRHVQIRVLTTTVSHIKSTKHMPQIDEEAAYKIKVAQHEQVQTIERIMFDVSVDYLINFRFKVRETPPLIGEPAELDTEYQKRYNTTLTQAYADTRNGVQLRGIATARFNLFYTENEVLLSIMIMKRILLDHEALVTIAQMIDLVREPPFHVEYNTRLISDSSIAMAIRQICFNRDMLRVVSPVETISPVDALYDSSSLIIDTSGRVYCVVCIGEINCLDSYLTKRSLASVEQDDHSLIDSYRTAYSHEAPRMIDLRVATQQLAKVVSASGLITDVREEWQAGSAAMKRYVKSLAPAAHEALAKWAIETASLIALKKVSLSMKKEMPLASNKTALGEHDLEIIKYLFEYYESNNLLVLIDHLRHTIVYDKYKPLDTRAGQPWYSKSTAKAATAYLPVGHVISDVIQLYQPLTGSWMKIGSIAGKAKNTDSNGKNTGDKNTDSNGKRETKYPLGFYIFEERDTASMSVIRKVKYTNDESSKGINIKFEPATRLAELCKALKIKQTEKQKKQYMIQEIMDAAIALQEKIYPARVFYRLVET